VSLEHARPLIRRYLVYKGRQEAMDRFLTQTKASAKITYLRDLSAPKAAASGRQPRVDETRMTLAEEGQSSTTTTVGR
jgi:hypothetical protein